MDATRFDTLTRLFASRLSRRAAIEGAAAGALAAFGLRHAANAEVSQAYCGNVSCKKTPGKCKDGCVCCVYPNGTSRCRPPDSHGSGCVVACAPGLRFCPDLGRCAACCTGGDCTDGDACTVDSCVNGVCRYDPQSCDDANACTVDSCDPVLGCQYQQIACDDNNPCTDDTCNPTSGCVSTPNTAACIAQGGAAGTCSSGTCVTNPTTTTTTTTAAPIPCTGCTSSQTACLANGSCADPCDSSNVFSCPSRCFCGFTSIEGPTYCVDGQGSCDSLAACSSTSQCPRGRVCQFVSCGDGTVAYRCVALCT